ncbi:MAG: hypothetical protein CVV03_01820 [Firmicutes bacterium HGW-Firmicutes-8]|nr:MAG: hypothetical protein CVV03_01820 [Firmicutes bacterium HGW-Firmicutes-8]
MRITKVKKPKWVSIFLALALVLTQFAGVGTVFAANTSLTGINLMTPSKIPGQPTSYQVSMQINSNLSAGDKIIISFPDNYNVAGWGVSVTGAAYDPAIPNNTPGQKKIEIPVTAAVYSAANVSVELSGITNPAAGVYGIAASTTQDNIPVVINLVIDQAVVFEVENIVSGEDKVAILGQDLDTFDPAQVTGAVYNGPTKVADLVYFGNDGPGCLFAQIAQGGIPPESYNVKLQKNGFPLGGQDQYPADFVPPVGIDKIFAGTEQKLVIMPNGNDFGSGTDIELLKAVVVGDMGAVICESVSNNGYGLMFSGSNLESGVPGDFNLPNFMVEIFKKNSPGEPYKFLSRGFFGSGCFGPEYNVGPPTAAPGDNIPLDIFGPGFDGTSTIQIFVYSGGSWVSDGKINLGSKSVINDVPPPGVHLQVPITVLNDAPVGPRKIKVTTGSSVVDIDNRFSIMLPMNVTLTSGPGGNVNIDPNGNPVGTDPIKIKLRVFVGPYPSGELVPGQFSIDGSGHIIIPLTSKPELEYAKDFCIEVVRISDQFMLGRGMYMKPGVGPDKVMPGSFNIPLDIWAPNLDATSSVAVKVYNGSSWVADANFVLDNSTRKIIVEPGNIGGAMKHFQIMMTVKQEAAIGPRQIVITDAGAVIIDNALTVMPNMGSLPADAPFMAGGSNVEQMGTVSPEIMFIGIGFTREILVASQGAGNYDTVKTAIQITKVGGGAVTGDVMNPPPPPGETNVVEKNVVLFKPTVALEAYSTYNLTINQGSILTTDPSVTDPAKKPLAMTYTATFTTGSSDTSSPSIVRVETRPSPTEGAIVFLFNKPVKKSDAVNLDNYNLTTTRPIPTKGIQAGYDPMSNSVKLFGYDLALGDSITGTVSGIQSTSGTLMNSYTVNATVQGFQMGGPGTVMTNTQKAFSPVEVRPTNPSAQSDSHYMVRMPVQQKLSAGDKIEIVFPAGFDVTSAVLDQGSPMNQDINGPGPGTVTIRSVSGERISRTVTVTLNNETGSSDFINFELKSIINGPEKQITFDQATGAPVDGYYCSVTTKSSSGTTKEGPMNSMLFPIAGAAAGGLTGKIVNNSGPGISNVTVYLDGPGGRKEALTSSTSPFEGTFSFTGLVPGGYFLSTDPSPSSGAYVGIMMPIQFFIDTTTKSAGNIVLDSTSGGTSTYYNLTVSVTSGSSLLGKQVDVFAGSPTSFNAQTITLDGNGAGSATLKVKAGTYMVGVGPAMPKGGMMGQMPVMDWMPPMPASQDIQDNKELTITINVPNATISGTVKDGNNNAIPNAEVYAYSPTGEMMGAHAMTDSSGTFSVKVKAGEYVVGAHAPGMPWIPEKKIVVAASQTVTVNFKYEALERTISGTVVDSDQRPIAKASVVAYRVNSASVTANPMPGFANAVTDSSGNFTLFVKPDSFWVLAGFAPNYGELPKQVVTVESSDVSRITITVQSSTMGTIQGTVTSGSSTVVNATVWAEGLSVAQEMVYGNKAVTNTQGSYALKLKQGNYRLHLWTPETGEVALPNDQALVTVGSTTVTRDLSLPQKGAITVIFAGEQPAGFEAFIHVKSADGKFQNGGFIKLKNGGTAQMTINVPVDQSGATYNLMIAVPGIGDSSTIEQFRNITATFAAGVTAEEVNITLPTKITLSGTVKVTDDSGAVVENAWVSINKKDAPFGAFKKTDASGNFSFNVPPGTYFLTADHPDYSSQHPVTITASGDITQDLYVDLLSDSFTIGGTIYKDSVSDSKKAGSNVVVWAIDLQGRWVGGEVDSSGTYTLTVPSTETTWMVQAAGDGYGTTLQNRQAVTISGASVSNKNLIMTPLTGYNIKPPKVESITPAMGGVLDDKDAGIKVTVPANALGSSVDSGQITAKETTGVHVTNLAKPAGSIGKEIKAADSSGNAITKLNDYVDIELDYSEQVDPDDSTKLLDGTPVDNVQLGYWDDNANNWVFIAATNDTENHILKGKVDHLTTFAPLVPTGEAPPSTPTDLTAEVAGSSQINLTWTVVTGATYNVYRADSGEGDYTKINTTTVTTNSYSNTGLSPSTTYYYKVSAVNATGESAASTAVNATTDAAAPGTPSIPSAPSGLAAAAAGSSQINLTWTAVTGATEYYVYRASSAGGTYTKINTTTVTSASYSNSGLSASTTYYYKVSAVSTGGESTKSDYAYATTTEVSSPGGAGAPAPAQVPITATVEKVININAPDSVKTADGAVELAIPQDTFKPASGEQIKVTIDKVETATINTILAKSSQPVEIKLIGNVFEFDALSVKSSTSTKVASFAKPIILKLSFSGIDLKNVDPQKLGIYRLDETSGQWVYIGGKVLAGNKTVTVALTHFSKYAILAYDKTFSDANSHWAKNDVEIAAARHFVSGVTKDSFAPNKDVTRAEFAVMLAKALSLTANSQAVAFKDVKAGDWFYSSVAAAVQAGIISGYNADTFAPNDKITREQMASMIARALRYKNAGGALTQAEVSAQIGKFTDGSVVASWAASDVAAVAKESIIKGRSSGDFAPKAKASRAEAAVMLNRLFDKV